MKAMAAGSVFASLTAFGVGYLSGSVLFACLISRLVLGRDIRSLKHANPGARSVFLSVGPVWGVVTFILDSSKGLLPMLIAGRCLGFAPLSLGMMGAGAIIGHRYPLFFGFRGGRSAATATGNLVALAPLELLGAFLSALGVGLLVKKDRRFWVPLTLFAGSTVAALILAHPLGQKIGVLLNVSALLFVNRDRIRTLNRAPEHAAAETGPPARR